MYRRSHHAVPSQEVRDDLSVNVIHQAPRTLVIIASINKELLAGVLIDEGTDLETGNDEQESMRQNSL